MSYPLSHTHSVFLIMSHWYCCTLILQSLTLLNTNVQTFTMEVIRTIRVKKKATIYKICTPLFDKKTRHNFIVCVWICAESALYGIAALLPNAPRFLPKHNSATWIATLYKTTHCGTAIKVRCTVGEKRYSWRHVFKCRCSACLLHSF